MRRGFRDPGVAEVCRRAPLPEGGPRSSDAARPCPGGFQGLERQAAPRSLERRTASLWRGPGGTRAQRMRALRALEGPRERLGHQVGEDRGRGWGVSDGTDRLDESIWVTAV
ncbi:hypothetical protein NDU88_006350 [Pleurodeles waltl]|uniref:Uncharacterized protein n=1 Tax=Pleurodeles waltl TaxID=8319 RepID=A0AAV7TY55_PLEWA|nr:hypothetical protein NDU88_006350 [Pleurodeles waltl]